MWHVSVSVRSGRTGQPQPVPALAEAAAVDALTGVGADTEWWHWNRDARVGHLRVPITTSEAERVPPGRAYDDAGETGPQRPRSR